MLVERVLVHDDGSPPDYPNPDANGITLELDDGSATVRNSIVYNIARSGIMIHNVKNARLIVENCTVWRCTMNDNYPEDYGGVGLFHSPMSEILAKNVIAVGAQGEKDFFVTRDGSFDLKSSNNIYQHQSELPTATTAFSSSPDELFVSIVEGEVDLHLSETSPAIDQGVTMQRFQDDVDGEVRPGGLSWDVGADERFP